MHELPREKTSGICRIPPFRDAHMHFMVGGRPARLEDVSIIGAAYARDGIFSLMDMGHRTGVGPAAKNILAGRMEVRSAGFAICKAGGYGEFLGRGVSGKAELIKVVREVSDAGADFIKVINSGVVSFKEMPHVTAGGFTLEELRIIHAEAGEKGMDMVCHANSDPAIRDAVAAGATSLEHGFFVSSETLHMIAELNVSWTPTVSALSNHIAALPQAEKKYADALIESHLSSINYAASIGIRLQAGTDSGSHGINHGESFSEELRFFKRAGLSGEQIVAAACMDMGEIEKGNYLLVKEDFIETGNLEDIYRGGKLFITLSSVI